MKTKMITTIKIFFEALHNGGGGQIISLPSYKKLRQGFLFSVLLVLSFAATSYGRVADTVDLTLKVSNELTGVTTQFIGACEGNINFDASDLTDLGINTYRIYGGMSRWEAEDDDNQYGWPSVSEIKRNPRIIPWERWDAVMMRPKTGSDYAFSGNPEDLWQGSANDIFAQLKQAHIRPVLTIRNSDSNWNPEWALQLNPPRTEADWNEWWEHVFATVYWLNVRNNYQVDDFEIHNEPDNRQQGWGGSQNDYFELARVAEDAIRYVYATYLPNREFHIHAPKNTGGSSWPAASLVNIPNTFNIVNVHNYDLNVASYVQQVREWMRNTIHEDSPIWLGEWGTYTGGYTDPSFSINLLKNLVRMAEPGDGHVQGSHIFSLYDWGNDFEGLIGPNGTKRLSYYAFRMGVRMLQGGKPILKTLMQGESMSAIATIDDLENLNLLIINDSNRNKQITIDLTALTHLNLEAGTIEAFSTRYLDEYWGEIDIESGLSKSEIPPQTAFFINFTQDDLVNSQRTF